MQPHGTCITLILMRPLVNRPRDCLPQRDPGSATNRGRHHVTCSCLDQFAGARKDLATTQQSSTTQLACFSSSNIIRNYSLYPSSYFIFCLYTLLPVSSVLLLLQLLTWGTLKSYPSLNTSKSINSISYIIQLGKWS